MADLQDYQWELGGVVFGIDCPVDHESDVAPPGLGWRTDDSPNPNSDGLNMGADFVDPAVWQFKLFTNGDSEAAGLQALMDLRDVWRGDAYRTQPGAVTTLRYRLRGNTRVVFGRPRHFDHPWGQEYLYGRIPITADFQTVSDLFYDDVEQSVWVDFEEPLSGGFVTPFTAPLTVSSIGTGSTPYSTFTVGGRHATPSVVEFHGPLLSPGMLIDGKAYIAFQNDVPADTVVTVDARPWITEVTRDDGGGVAGLLSPRSRMPRMVLEPGVHSATLLGSSPDGTGRARIRWRPAYPSV